MNTRVGVPEVGEQIGGRYELLRPLGSGAAGVVYEAAHVHIGRRVALKWLYPHLAAEEVTAKRFFLEARAACLIDHPNVIDVFDGGKDRDSLFLVMELLEGEPLSDRMRRGFSGPHELVELLIPALDGVAAAHKAGIIHRDLKPENIFLAEPRGGRAGGPKVLDFGISKLTENREQLTSAGSFVGSPYYMAPEQIQDASAVDARVDLYAIGVILYESLSGQLPFESESLTDLFFKVTREKAPPILDIVPDLDQELATVVHKSIATDPAKRFQSAQALASALARFRSPSVPAAARGRRDTDAAPSPFVGSLPASADTIATDGNGIDASVSAWELASEQTVADAQNPHGMFPGSDTGGLQNPAAQGRAPFDKTLISDEPLPEATLDPVTPASLLASLMGDENPPSTVPPAPRNPSQQEEPAKPATKSVRGRWLLHWGVGILVALTAMAITMTLLLR